ncbi:MAG: hypothetical protein JRN62_03820 [Nitrososphaerota archaeon]|jgi:hypothetical protein|nr:hypothetical protein [Nitrososphaerota archaeon]MDG6948730.1 hypothetical protein [Nitrososphaerota archaeon]
MRANPKKDPTIQVDLTGKDFSNIVYGLKLYLNEKTIRAFLPGATDEYIKEKAAKFKATADALIDQVHEYRRSHTTVDDAGVVHLHIYYPRGARLFTYTCRDCGGSMTIEADDGHPAWQYWKENHKCNRPEA